jgi:hypothetical protein
MYVCTENIHLNQQIKKDKSKFKVKDYLNKKRIPGILLVLSDCQILLLPQIPYTDKSIKVASDPTST